jgi:hypothetical protein
VGIRYADIKAEFLKIDIKYTGEKVGFTNLGIRYKGIKVASQKWAIVTQK